MIFDCRNQLKARYVMNAECHDALVEDIAGQVGKGWFQCSCSKAMCL